jgi:hypothetical protein
MIRQHAKTGPSKQSWLISRSYLVPVVFVIAFSGIGVSLLLSSNAQTPCAKQTILVGQHGGCVQDIQEILNATGSNWGGSLVAVSGHFDSGMQTQLEKFQGTTVAGISTYTGGTASGIVDTSTWRALCYADNIWQGSQSAFVNAGCETVFGVAWDASYSTSP